jgi:acetylglutamate kinase
LDYGFVGDIDTVNISLLKDCLANELTPVVAPITSDKKGQLLNTNADTVAQEIAKAMSGLYEVELIYTFEKKGVMFDVNDDSSVISNINSGKYHQLKAENKIFAGMIPKLDNAFAALNSGVKKVRIGKAEELEQLIEGKTGTVISNES